MDSLIFIDTNIFLDFYRFSSDSSGIMLLNRLLQIKDKIILTNQVIMEFKKNRQNVMMESYKQMIGPDWSGLKWPLFISQPSTIRKVKSYKKEILDLQNDLKNQIVKSIRNPRDNDEIFRELDKLFNSAGKNFVNEKYNNLNNINTLALARFQRGYPPKKEKDNSCGDAINWECIIDRAKIEQKDVILVTRDSDYGVNIENYSVTNDWLLAEFKSRVNPEKHIAIEKKLSTALRTLGEEISEKEEKDEIELLEKKRLAAVKELEAPIKDPSLLKKLIEQFNLEIENPDYPAA